MGFEEDYGVLRAFFDTKFDIYINNRIGIVDIRFAFKFSNST